MEHGQWVPTAIRMTVFDVKSGAVSWRKIVSGGDLMAVADASRLYIRIQLPLVTNDAFDYKPEDSKYEIFAFRWSDGRLVWHRPVSYTQDMLAWNGKLFYQDRKINSTQNDLVAVEPETGRELWRSQRRPAYGLLPAHGVLYAYDDSRDPDGEFLSSLDTITGHTIASLLIYPQFRPTSQVSALEWIPAAGVLVCAIEQNRTPGTNLYLIRALDADGKPAWELQNAGRFKMVGKTLICQSYETQHEYSHAVMAVDPATGRVLWRRTDISNSDGYFEFNLGEWRGYAVALQGSKLLGLNPRNGKTSWTLDTHSSRVAGAASMQAQIVGDVILVASGATKDRPAQVRAYGLGRALKPGPNHR